MAVDQATVVTRLATLEHSTALFNRLGASIADGPPEFDPVEFELYWDPDADWSPLTGSVVEGASYRGLEGQRAYWHDLTETWRPSRECRDAKLPSANACGREADFQL